jgi:hypothetical protein
MKMVRFALAGLIALGIATSVHAQLTGQVYQITMAGGLLTTEEISPGTEVLVKDTFNTAAVINVARGRNAEAPVPANEKLAVVIVFNDPPVGALVVYDSNAESILTEIARLDIGGAIDSAKGKGFVAMAGGINSTGQFSGGWIAMSGKATVTGFNTPAPQLSFSAAIQGVFRGSDGEDNFEVVVTKGKAAVVGRLGTVVLGDE